MRSVRSRLMIWLLRHRHLFKLRLKPEVVDESFSVEKFRAGVDRVSRRMNRKIPGDISVEPVDIHGMGGEIISPGDAPAEKIILYIHGGGFISGSCLTHRMHVIKFARGSGVKALLFDYRLAPESPYPAALEDCVTAYQWLLSQGYHAADIVIAGESAGGTLTLSTLLKLRDMGIPLPARGVSISPVTDLTCRAASFRYNAGKDIAPRGSWDVWTRYYIDGCDPGDPLLSPLMHHLDGLPELMIQVGSHEIHLDDAVGFARKAEAAGSPVRLRVWTGMVHAFPILSPLFPEARAAMAEICAFIRGDNAGIASQAARE